MAQTDAIQRTTPDDDLFIRMDRAAGLAVVCQIVWKLPDALEPGELERFGAGLAAGEFDRVLRRGRVPLARDHWVRGARVGQTIIDPTGIAADEIHTWIDDATDVEFDLVDGPVWELRSTPILGGGVVVSLTYFHAVADGAFLFKNIRAALGITRPTDSALPAARLRDDVADACGQLRRMGSSAVSLAAVGLRSRRRRSDVQTITPVTSQSIPFPDDVVVPAQPDKYLAPFAVADVPTQQWLAAARRHGGSGNSLFIAIVVGILVGAGRAEWDDTVRVSIPMTARTRDDDIRSNATTGRSLDLAAQLCLDRDLAGVKELAKRMYVESAQRKTTFAMMQTFVQGMSDRTLLRLNRRASTPLAVASNLGSLEPEFSGLGRADRMGTIMMRSTTPAVSRERLIQLRGGLLAGLTECGPTTTITIGGLDPVAFPDSGSLSKLLAEELARWSLEPTLW